MIQRWSNFHEKLKLWTAIVDHYFDCDGPVHH